MGPRVCLWTVPGLSFCILDLSELPNAVLNNRVSQHSSPPGFMFSVSKHMEAGPTQASNSHSVPGYSRYQIAACPGYFSYLR